MLCMCRGRYVTAFVTALHERELTISGRRHRLRGDTGNHTGKGKRVARNQTF